MAQHSSRCTAFLSASILMIFLVDSVLLGCVMYLSSKTAQLQRQLDAFRREKAPVPVFKVGDGGLQCFRHPGIVRAQSGQLLAVAEAHASQCSDVLAKVVVKTSANSGQDWSDILVVGTAARAPSNPSLLALSSGKVLLVYRAAGTGPEGAEDSAPEAEASSGGEFATTALFSTADEGATWEQIPNGADTSGLTNSAWLDPGAAVSVQMAGNRSRVLLLPTQREAGVTSVTYSEDEGATWAIVNWDSAGFMSVAAVDLGDEQVLLTMLKTADTSGEHEELGLWASRRSLDGGLTWNEITDEVANADLVGLGTLARVGDNLFLSGIKPSEGNETVARMIVRRSMDGGLAWSSSLDIAAISEDGAPRTGQSCLVPGRVGDGGGVLYEAASRGTIDFAWFPLSLEGSDTRAVTAVTSTVVTDAADSGGTEASDPAEIEASGR